MKKNKKLLKNLKKSLDIVESEIKLDENGGSIDLELNGGSSLILECEIGCEELSNLKSGIDSISSVLGNSGDCFISPQGFSICPETIYDKLNNLSSDKIGENNGLAGTETLFQLNHLIKDSLTSTFSQFGEETILGKIDKIEKNKLGNCGDQSICEILQGNSNNLSSLQSTLNLIKSSVNNVQNSVNSVQSSVNGVQSTVNTLPTLTSIENSTVLAKQAALNSIQSSVNNVQSAVSGVQSTVNTLPTLTSIEDSLVLAKEATLNSIKAETDLIGLPADTSSDQTLFGKIADVKQDIAGINCGGGGGGFDPLDPCFLKVMARFAVYAKTGNVITFNQNGSPNTPYLINDPIQAFNALIDPYAWTVICNGL